MKTQKIILVTGISSGIGNAFVKEALRYPGTKVVGLGRHPASDIKDKSFFFQQTDLNSEKSIYESFKAIIKKFNRIDILINNAGVGYRGTIEDMTMVEIRDQFEANFFGLIYLTKLVLPIMRQQNGGQIINIDSVASTVSTPTLGFYAATKSAVEKISEILDQEVSPYNITVNLLVPGAVKSSFGKNIIEAKNAPVGVYTNLYAEWKLRFRSYFNKNNSSNEVAKKLISMIDRSSPEMFVAKRDWLMCYLKKTLPKPWFKWLFLNYYYKYES